MYSDNGKNFVGASKKLAQDFLTVTKAKTERDFQSQDVRRHFILPGAPHMGGLWEAGVKSFKQHFKKAAHPFKFVFEKYSTLLAKIEACLNSRPLSPLSEDRLVHIRLEAPRKY